MKIIVCMKQVPDTTTRVRIGPDGRGIVESDISFNNNVTWTTTGAQYDTEAVMAHELGHSLGIHHSDVSTTATMYAFYFGSAGRSLASDDISALQCAESRY